MSEASDELHRAVEIRSRSQDPAEVLADIANRVRRKRRNRRAGRGCAVVLVIACGVAALLAADGIGDGESSPDLLVRDEGPPTSSTTVTSTTTTTTTTTDSAALPTVEATGVTVYPPPPIEVRGDAAVVWTGSELVVWGGDVEAANMGLPGPDRTFVDGAAFDPTDSAWRTMSAAPLPGSRSTPVGLVTDHGVLVARDRAAGLWDPATDEWTELPDAPGEITDLVGGGSFAISTSANAVLDVTTETWSVLPDPPLDLHRPSSVWTGTSLIVVGGPDTPFTTAAAISYDPATGVWSVLAEIPDLTAEAISATWDGQHLIAVNYDMSAFSYDRAADRWTQLPPVPARFSEWYPTTLTTGEFTIARMAQAVAVLGDDGWLPLPARSLVGDPEYWSEVVPIPGSDATFMVWSLDPDADTNRLVAVDLESVFAASPTIQVGVAGLRVGDDIELTSTSYTRRPSETVTAELTIDAEPCTMASTYGYGGQDPAWSTISLPNDGIDTPWRVNPEGTVMSTAATTSDLVTISCERPTDAHEVARRTTFEYHEQRDG